MVRSKKKPAEEHELNATFPFDGSEAGQRLRREAAVRRSAVASEELPAPETLYRALEELRIHQIELEMQNEELRRAQLELDVARSRYFDLYDLAPIGYCTLNLPGVIVQTNLAAVTMLGMSRAAAIGRAFARFVHPQDQSVLHRLLTSAKAEEPQSAELRMLRLDGSQLWAHLAVSLAQNEGGGLERRVVLSDVTVRRQAEDGQHAMEGRYRELFSRAPEGILVCGADGGLEDVNAAFRVMHGWGPDEGVGRNLRELDRDGVTLAPERVGRMLSGEVSNFQVTHRHQRGHGIALDVSTSLIFVSGTPHLLAYYRPGAHQAASP